MTRIRAVPLQASSRVFAIHGIGGVGKSTLARAICSDPDVRRIFADGILWAELGDSPDLLSYLTEWLGLVGDPHSAPLTIAEAVTRLRVALHGKHVMFVLDDVCSAQDARQLCRASSSATVLVTTRHADAADALGADTFPLGVMTQPETQKLFESWIHRPLLPAELPSALALATDVGHLPLALSLCAAMASRGIPWDEIQHTFTAQYHQCLVLDDLTPQLRTVLACLHTSLIRLGNDHRDARSHFGALGVLNKGCRLNVALCSRIWSASTDDAQRWLGLLSDRAIIQRHNAGFGLHSLMHDLARFLLYSRLPTGLGLSPHAAHASFLSTYGAPFEDIDWSAHNDGYTLSNLSWHLEQASDWKRLHGLLTRSSPTGTNYWYTTLRSKGLLHIVQGDIARASGMAIHSERPFESLLMYALMHSSLVTLDDRYSIGIVVAMLARRFMSPSHAIAWACGRPDRSAAAAALAMLAERFRDGAIPGGQEFFDHTLALALESWNQIGDLAPKAQIGVSLLRLGDCPAAAVIHKNVEELCLQWAESGRTDDASRMLADLPSAAALVSLGRAPAWLASGRCTSDFLIALVNRASEQPLTLRTQWMQRVIEWLRAADDVELWRPVFAAACMMAEGDAIEPLAKLLPRLGTRKLADDLREAAQGDGYGVREAASALGSGKGPRMIHAIARHGEEIGASARGRITGALLEAWHAESPALASEELRSWMDALSTIDTGMYDERLAVVGKEVVMSVLRREPERKQYANSDDQNCLNVIRRLPPLMREACTELTTELMQATKDEELHGVLIAILVEWGTDASAAEAIESLRIGDIESQARLSLRIGAESGNPELLMSFYNDARHSDRVRALGRILGDLRGGLKVDVLRDFIDVAVLVASEWWIVEALFDVSRRVTRADDILVIVEAAAHIAQDDLRTKAIARAVVEMIALNRMDLAKSVAGKLADRRERERAIADGIIKLAERGDVQAAHDAVAGMEACEERWRAQAEVALYVGTADGESAKRLAEGIGSSMWRDWALSKLATWKSGSGDQWISGSPRREVARDGEWLRRTIQEYQRGASAEASWWRRTEELLQKNDDESRELAWRGSWSGEASLLVQVSEMRRYRAFAALLPVVSLARICGEDAEIDGIGRAARDVANWWP